MTLTLAIAGILAWHARVSGQFIPGSRAFDVVLEDSSNELQTELENLPVLEDIFHPEKYQVPRSYYEYKPPDRALNYTQNVVFDPCRGFPYNCCNDTFGTPEFRRERLTEEGVRETYWVRDDGSEVPHESTRWSTAPIYINERCQDVGDPFPNCIGARLASKDSGMMPRCWNYNDTIVADRKCRAPSDGSVIPTCLEIGYTQNAYIVECGGDFEDDPHCGTFLEIHRPNHQDILAEIKLKAVFTSGYRMAVMSMTYRRDDTKSLCYDSSWKGRYEIWWVQRTRTRFFIQNILPFVVVSPWCDWDATLNRFYPFATLPGRSALPVEHPFAPEKLVLTRTRTQGTVDGRPGPGMGGLYISRDPSAYPPNAEFFTQDDVTYSYAPITPEYTVKRGIIEPPNVDDGDI